ncbi:MAG: hypothetical protein IKB64_00890 [Paludibacteraceae bacterium]|nr:hypothetical protein [Paludibacteraceae bacterium]
MEEEKKEQVEKQEKTLTEKLKEVVEAKIEKLLETGIQAGNADYLYKLVDIHKDIENEEYWKIKKEVLENDVR